MIIQKVTFWTSATAVKAGLTADSYTMEKKNGVAYRLNPEHLPVVCVHKELSPTKTVEGFNLSPPNATNLYLQCFNAA